MIRDDDNSKILTIITLTITVIAIVGLTSFSFYRNNKTVHENFIKAQDLFRKAEFMEAEKLLDVKPPKDIAKEFYELKFNAQMNQEAIYAAKETLLELIKLQPKNAFYQYELGLIYYNMGDYKQAQEYYKKAIEIEPDNFSYNNSLANIYFEQGNYDDAIKVFLDIYKKNPKAEIALASVAHCYEQKNDMNNALKYREQAAREFSTNLFDVYTLAQTYEKMNKKEKAIEYYAKAIDLDFDNGTNSREKYKELSGKTYYAKGFNLISVPYYVRDNLMVVKANLGGKGAEFIVDTGASFCSVSKNFIQGIKTRDLGLNAVVTFADGSKANAPLVLAKLALSGFDFGEVLVAVLPKDDVPFLLGNNVMQDLDYYIDRNKKVIAIKRPKE